VAPVARRRSRDCGQGERSDGVVYVCGPRWWWRGVEVSVAPLGWASRSAARSSRGRLAEAAPIDVSARPTRSRRLVASETSSEFGGRGGWELRWSPSSAVCRRQNCARARVAALDPPGFPIRFHRLDAWRAEVAEVSTDGNEADGGGEGTDANGNEADGDGQGTDLDGNEPDVDGNEPDVDGDEADGDGNGADGAMVGVISMGVARISIDVGAIPTGVGAIPTGVGAIPTGVGVIPTGVGAIPTGVGAIPTCGEPK
jgi:hypothetical protein